MLRRKTESVHGIATRIHLEAERLEDTAACLTDDLFIIDDQYSCVV